MQQAFVPHLPLRSPSTPTPLPPKPSLHPRRSRPIPIPSSALHTLRTDDPAQSSTPQSPADWLRANEQSFQSNRDALRIGCHASSARSDQAAPASVPTPRTAPSPLVVPPTRSDVRSNFSARHSATPSTPIPITASTAPTQTATLAAARTTATVLTKVNPSTTVPSSPAGSPSPLSQVRRIPAVLRVGSFSTSLPASPPSYCHVTPDLEHLISQLRERVSYLGPVTHNKVVRAIELARSTGATPATLSYNVAIALIVADLQMDCETVCAALIRGLIRPTVPAETHATTHSASTTTSPTLTPPTPSSSASTPELSKPIHACSAEVVERDVGADVLRILKFHARLEESVNLCVDASFTEMSFSNLRELILVGAMGEHRAISLDLARAVLSMRSVEALPDMEARICMARRSMYLYAPLANQLGIYFVQSELEELAFMYLQPDNYNEVRKLVGERRRECEGMLTRSKEFLERILSTTPKIRSVVRSVQIKGRVKGLHSVHRKMRRSGKEIDEIYDLLALRVVVQPKRADDESENAACYAVAELIKQHYETIQSRGKDYIAEPKRNGYRSLHMTVLPHGGSTPLEIQIRSEKMHHVAEFGAAAHWIYKEKPDEEDATLSDFDSDNDAESDDEDDEDAEEQSKEVQSEYNDDAFSPFSMEEDLVKPTVLSDISASPLPRSRSNINPPVILQSPRSVQVKSETQDGQRSERRTRRGRRMATMHFPRPRVPAVGTHVNSSPADGKREPTAHEVRMNELVSQRLSATSSSQQIDLQNELRGGYVACLASAIRATRVIVAVAGQVYGLAVGSTLLDLASGLGVATLGAVAVVNGSVAPLTQRLEMNDIVWFI